MERPDDDIATLVVFDVGGQRYALEIASVREIVNPLPLTPVPNAPRLVEGVVESRGAIFPIVDLRRRFGLEKTPYARATRFIVVAIRGRIVGLVVDSVREVVRISRADIRITRALGNQKRASLFTGAYRHQSGMVMMLDIEQVLSSEDAIAISQEEML